jgi:hypothetical protein
VQALGLRLLLSIVSTSDSVRLPAVMSNTDRLHVYSMRVRDPHGTSVYGERVIQNIDPSGRGIFRLT